MNRKQINAVVAKRDTLREQLERINVKADLLDAEIQKVRQRQDAVARELNTARIAAARDEAGAAERVEALLAERTELAQQYHVTQARAAGPNPVLRDHPGGELYEQAQALAQARKQVERDLRSLYREATAELLAHAASFVTDAEAKLAAELEARQIAEAAWNEALAELRPLERYAGVGALPAFPVEVRGSSMLRPGEPRRGSRPRERRAGAVRPHQRPRRHQDRRGRLGGAQPDDRGLALRTALRPCVPGAGGRVSEHRHLCTCSRPLITENEPAFATAQQWVDRLEAAQHRNALDDELRRIERYALIVVDEIGYLPLERQAANLLFALVARRYERGSIIVTSNRGFEAWGEILGDAMVAAALIDRLIHHAHMVTLKGKSYRLRERATGAAPAVQAPGLRPSA
jgi:IstB-like ATP binding protein